MEQPASSKKKKRRPFRRAILTGLAVILPSLLTIVIFLWVGNTIKEYLLDPVEFGSRWLVREFIVTNDIREEKDFGELDSDKKIGYVDSGSTRKKWYRVEDGRYIPDYIYKEYEAEQVTWRKVLNENQQGGSLSAEDYFDTYVELDILPSNRVIPAFFFVFIILLYLLGRFLAAGAGRLLFKMFEDLINRIPLIRNVYGTVKQVTDMVFTESSVEFTRVVAVEYPRKGIFSLGLVTGESFLDLRAAANEPVVSVLMPTSPLPMTGFTVTFKKSETIDVNITIDQAIQFIVSCGVVVPPHQMSSLVAGSTQTEQNESGQQAALTGPSDDQG